MDGTRSAPFGANEWRLFGAWLSYVEKGLDVAYDLARHGDAFDRQPPAEVSTADTGARWYASDLALLHSLVYRAAGKRSGEEVCADQEIATLSDEIEAAYPELRHLRNALFAHPPFVDRLLSSDNEVLTLTASGVHVVEARLGASPRVIVDTITAHTTHVPSWINRFRTLIGQRMDSAST